MLFLNNPLLLLLLVLLWSLDIWLWLAVLRFLLELLPFPRARAFAEPLQQLTDPIPLWINTICVRIFRTELPTCSIWAITVVLAWALRHVLLSVVITIYPIT